MSAAEEKKGMDPIVISSLLTLATQVAGLAIKYNDPNTQAPAAETVLAHLAKFQELQPLPEEYDEGFVDEAMGYIKNLLQVRE